MTARMTKTSRAVQARKNAWARRKRARLRGDAEPTLPGPKGMPPTEAEIRDMAKAIRDAKVPRYELPPKPLYTPREYAACTRPGMGR